MNIFRTIIVLICLLPVSAAAQLYQSGEPPYGIYQLAKEILLAGPGEYRGKAPECSIFVGSGDSTRSVTTFFLPKVHPEVLYSPALSVTFDGDSRVLEFPFAIGDRLVMWRAFLPSESARLVDTQYVCKMCDPKLVDDHRLELNTRELTDLLPALRQAWLLLYKQ